MPTAQPPRGQPKSPRIADLTRLLDTLRIQQQQLLDCIESKLDAVRRADVPAMQRLHRLEARLVKQLRECEGLRRQMMDAIGRALGWPVGAGRTLHVSKLASRAQGPDRAPLLDAAKALRDVVFRVQRANRVVGAVSRNLVDHLGAVFASVAPKADEPTGYSGSGAVVRHTGTLVFEAVG